MELNWQTDRTASACWAAVALARDQELVDSSVARGLSPHARHLRDFAGGHGLSLTQLSKHLLPLSSDRAGREELAKVTIRKALGPDKSPETHRELATLLGDVVSTFQKAVPRLKTELELREQPIRQQWEARGPGVLHGMRRLVDGELLPPQARIVLVYPVLGGGGEAFVAYNLVHLEAMLTNVDDRLPEVVRLAWLLSCLNLELPRYSDGLGTQRIGRIGPMAMLPLALASASEVELARFDLATVRLAMELWRVRSAANDELAGVIYEWGETYLAARPPFRTAVLALERLLEGFELEM